MKTIIFLVVLLSCSALIRAQDDEKEFNALVAKADELSNLTAPGSPPFHLKLRANDIRMSHLEFNTEIEIWWAAADKWRREIKSSGFSQTAVQNGTHYSESNSSEYFPWWLHQIITDTLDPLPLEELKIIEPDMQGPTSGRCAHWESVFSEASDKITVYNQACFNGDGTLHHIFSRTAGGSFADYRTYRSRRVPGVIHIDARSADGQFVDLVSHLNSIEPLPDDPNLFSVTQDTGLAARARFVNVPQAALLDYKLEVPPVKWPPIHNFPATGMMAINIKIDRDGIVRAVGSPISANVVLSDPAVSQIKNWKFKPFLVDGAPVQVNTYIALRFDAKVELLGSNGASAPVVPFFQRIQKSRQLTDLNLLGSSPFHVHATIQYLDNSTGTCDEVWQAPTQWRREAKLGNVSVTESQNGDHTYRKIEGSAFSPRQIDAFLDELDGHFPQTDGSFIEGDWGQSAVQLNGVDLVRVARGKVDANNQPISGQAYWFDSIGLLRAAYVAPRVSIYSAFSDWNGKHVPHKIEVSENSETLFRVSIDKIESQSLLPDSEFVVQGAKVEKIGDSDDYRGPVLVQPSPIYKPKPVNPHTGYGKVIVDVQLDPRGHVRTAEIRRSAGKDLDAAEIQAAMRWEFTPMRIRGHAVPGHAVIEFKFND